MANITIRRDGSLPPGVKWRFQDLGSGVYAPERYVAGGTISTTPNLDNAGLDAFARRRMSTPFTIFDSKQIWDDTDIANSAENYPLFWDNQEVSGSGTSTTFNVNRASTTLAVSNATAGTRTRQTKQRFNYQPGKSQLTIFTYVMGATSAGNTKSIGLFDDDNGIYLRDDGGTIQFAIRSNATGSAVDRTFDQADWNLDTMDGVGASGIDLDFTKSLISFIDFEWLGTGRIRFGFFIGGSPIYAHQVLNANMLDVVYMSTPNLPFRSQIINDGIGGADSLESMCVTVISEGGIQPNGTFRFGNIGTTTAVDITAATPGNAYAICGIKLKAAYISAEVREAFLSILETSGANNPFLWKLHLNPTLTTGLTYSNVTNSAIQFGVGLTTGDVLTAEGTVLSGGYISRELQLADVDLQSALRLGSLIDGTLDELVVSGSPLTNNQTYFGGIQWREVW